MYLNGLEMAFTVGTVGAMGPTLFCLCFRGFNFCKSICYFEEKYCCVEWNNE